MVACGANRGRAQVLVTECKKNEALSLSHTATGGLRLRNGLGKGCSGSRWHERELIWSGLSGDQRGTKDRGGCGEADWARVERERAEGDGWMSTVARERGTRRGWPWADARSPGWRVGRSSAAVEGGELLPPLGV